MKVLWHYEMLETTFEEIKPCALMDSNLQPPER